MHMNDNIRINQKDNQKQVHIIKKNYDYASLFYIYTYSNTT